MIYSSRVLDLVHWRECHQHDLGPMPLFMPPHAHNATTNKRYTTYSKQGMLGVREGVRSKSNGDKDDETPRTSTGMTSSDAIRTDIYLCNRAPSITI